MKKRRKSQRERQLKINRDERQKAKGETPSAAAQFSDRPAED